jgi:hypothetical protein
MTTTDFCHAITDQGRLGNEVSAAMSDFLRACDQRKFAPAGEVAVGILPAAAASGAAPGLDAVAQALKLIELAEARRAQLPPLEPALPAPQGPRAYRGASKG